MSLLQRTAFSKSTSWEHREWTNFCYSNGSQLVTAQEKSQVPDHIFKGYLCNMVCCDFSYLVKCTSFSF